MICIPNIGKPNSHSVNSPHQLLLAGFLPSSVYIYVCIWFLGEWTKREYLHPKNACHSRLPGSILGISQTLSLVVFRSVPGVHEYAYVRSGLNSHYFHIIGDKLINPIVGVYRAPLQGFLLKGGIFPIPNKTRLLTMAHLEENEAEYWNCRIFYSGVSMSGPKAEDWQTKNIQQNDALEKMRLLN